MTLQDAVDDYPLRHDQDIFPVNQNGGTVGFITTRMMHTVPRDELGHVLVRDAMLPLDRVIVVTRRWYALAA